MLAAAPHPPVLKECTFIGVLPEFRKAPPQFLLKVAREHGDIAQFRLGPQSICAVFNPEWIKDILVTHQIQFHQEQNAGARQSSARRRTADQ